jgi:hypothetical protein
VGNPVGYTWEEALAARREKAHMLDASHFYTRVYGDPDRFPDRGWPRGPTGLVLVGIILWHRATDGQACGGYVCFARGEDDEKRNRPTWTVESLEPLTISPSVLCKGDYGCGGTHGFIREGKWVSA